MSAQNSVFSVEGIRRAVVEAANLSEPCHPDMFGRSIVDAVRKHATGRAQNDDIALVCFGRLDSSSSVSTLPEQDFAISAQLTG